MCYAVMTIDTEKDIIWKEIPNHPGYLISNEGQVWSERLNRFLIIFEATKYKYKAVSLRDPVTNNPHKYKTKLLHCLLLETFIGQKPNISGTRIVGSHKDKNILNNNLSNLEWSPLSQSQKHPYKLVLNNKEDLKPIPGFAGYEIDNTGKVWSSISGKFLKAKPNFYGYPCVRLKIKEKGPSKLCHAHHLVWETFVGPRNKKLVINHKDGNKANSNLNNLEEVTKKEDVNHAWKMGFCENIRKVASNQESLKQAWAKCWKLNQEKADKIRELHNQGTKNKQLAEMFNISERQIRDIVKGKYWNNNKEVNL